jgi:DNA-binding XRE family transcriptional regulator
MEQNKEPLENYLRIHRKKAGLTLRELGLLLGYRDDTVVSRHESRHLRPTLIAAINYAILYQAPISNLFLGIHGTAEKIIEARILEFQRELEQHSGHGAGASLVAQKLVWIYGRRAVGDE